MQHMKYYCMPPNWSTCRHCHYWLNQMNQWACHRLKLYITSTNQKLCTLQEAALSHKQITKHYQNLITPYFLLANYAIQWKKCFTSNEGSGWSGRSNKRRHEFGPGMLESTINHRVVKVKLTLQTEVLTCRHGASTLTRGVLADQHPETAWIHASHPNWCKATARETLRHAAPHPNELPILCPCRQKAWPHLPGQFDSRAVRGTWRESVWMT